MRYLPATMVAIGVSVATVFALYLTKDVHALWGFLGFFLVYRTMPFQKDER